MLDTHILLILSDPQLGKLLQSNTLEPAGYQVSFVQSLDSGRKILGSAPIHLMIVGRLSSDKQPPEIVETLSSNYPTIPVILIGDTTNRDFVLSALRSGVSGIIELPIKPAGILTSVRTALERWKAIRDGVQVQSKQQAEILREQAGGIDELENIGRSITTSLDVDYVLTAIVDAAVKITGAEEGSLLILDDESGDLVMRASRNFRDEFVRTFRLPVNDTLAGEVIRTGESVLFDKDTPEKIKTSYLVRSLMYVPLKVKDRVIGVLGVDNRESQRSFTRHHLSRVSTLADYAAIAIENARLFSNTEIERQKLETILTHIEDGVIVVGFDNRIVLVNPVARNMFNLEGVPTVSASVDEVIHNEEFLELFNQENDFPYRCEIALEDGRCIHVQLVEIPEVGLAATLQDITYFKELDRIKSDFVNTVSHDLRSPLTAILGYVELISRVGDVNDQQRAFIERVQISVHNITSLINDLLDLGRIETGFDAKKEFVPLYGIIKFAADSIRDELDERGHKLILNLDEEVPKVYGDPARLRQVVEHLLSNASLYMSPRGTITLNLRAENDQVILQVEDTGLGIPPTDQPYIFDKFYRASNVPDDSPGSGLGLAIVKSIVENHHGRVWASSKLAGGSSFTVVLPIADDEL